MSVVVILHLSDLHFGGDWGDQQLAERQTVLGNLIEIVAKQEALWRPTCVCVSGDIGFRGTKSDYDAAGIGKGDITDIWKTEGWK